MKAFSGDDKVGQIAREYPWAKAIFAKHGVDTSDAGDQQIMDAVGEKVADVSSILDDLNSAYAAHEGKPEIGR